MNERLPSFTPAPLRTGGAVRKNVRTDAAAAPFAETDAGALYASIFGPPELVLDVEGRSVRNPAALVYHAAEARRLASPAEQHRRTAAAYAVGYRIGCGCEASTHGLDAGTADGWAAVRDGRRRSLTPATGGQDR